MTIVDYLAELRRSLPGDPLFRRRVLAEVEGHLRESAAAVGEDEAIARMGSPGDLGRSFASGAAAAASRWAAGLVALATIGVLAAYGPAESALPPAPWPSADVAPAFIRWTTEGAKWSFVIALAAELGALLMLPLRLHTAALGISCICAFALASACVFTVAGEVHRAQLYGQLDVPGRLSALELVVGGAYLLLLAAVALVAAGWATRVWLTAQRASSSYGLRR